MMRTMLIAFWWHRSTNAQQAAEKFRQRTHYRRLYSIISVRPSSSIVVPFLFYFCRAAGRKCLTDLRWEKKGFKRKVEGGEVPPSFMWTAKTTKTHWTSECCLQLEFRITQGPQNTTFLFSSVFSTASTAFQWPFFFLLSSTHNCPSCWFSFSQEDFFRLSLTVLYVVTTVYSRKSWLTLQP